MRAFFTRRHRFGAALAVLAVAASGCSVLTTTHKLDMQPFAENTVTSIGEMRKIEAPPVWIRLRPYFSDPAVLEARKTAQPLLDLVRSVNAYSLQVVSLNESRISEKSKCRELARFLEGASQRAMLKEGDTAEIALTAERLAPIMKDIASREKFMDALQAAEPIVNAVLARGLDLSDQVDESISRAVASIEVKVQAQYRAMLANRAALLVLQERAMQAQAWAEGIEFGDDAAVDELRKNVPGVAEYLPAGKKPTPKDQQGLVVALAAQALRIKAALDQLDPQYQAYRESILELDNLRARTTENAKLARSVLMVWARSHKNLARGVEVPPMFDLSKVILSAAGTAAKGIVPLP
jgi:hypothetical protein